ncbi:cyclophilin-like fold protein [Paenibacillus sp. TAF58]
MAIFYKDFGYANGLVRLGHIESGVEKLSKISGNFKVTIEQM